MRCEINVTIYSTVTELCLQDEEPVVARKRSALDVISGGAEKKPDNRDAEVERAGQQLMADLARIEEDMAKEPEPGKPRINQERQADAVPAAPFQNNNPIVAPDLDDSQKKLFQGDMRDVSH